MTGIKQNPKQFPVQLESPSDYLPVPYFVTNTLSHVLEVTLIFNSVYGSHDLEFVYCKCVPDFL